MSKDLWNRSFATLARNRNFFFLFLAVVVSWAIFGSLQSENTLGSAGSIIFICLAGALTLAAIIAVLRKVYSFSQMMKHAIEIEGEITWVSHDKSGMEYGYTFDYDGKTICGIASLISDKVTFTEGQKVTIIVDSKHPKTSIIKDLYS